MSVRGAALWACALFTVCALLTGCDGGAPPATTAGDRPNILVLLVDDVGFGDLHCYGGETLTPALDRLAAEGTRFLSAYSTAPNCAPSRAALLTGRYSQRFGFEFNPQWLRSKDNPRVGLPAEETTVAEALQARGYHTALIGKWHLGLHSSHHPQRHGFHEFFGFRMGATAYTLQSGEDILEEWVPGADAFQGRHPEDPIVRGETPVDEPEYLTQAFGREAADFVRRNQDRPFFLLTSFSAVHTPLQVTREHYDRFPDESDERARIYKAMLASLDDAIATILGALTECGLDDDTLVVFASDNGGADFIADSNGALRGGKGTFFEGGIRVPMMIRWPGRVEAGATEARLSSLLDITPTAIAAAGASGGDAPLDGVDLLPRLADRDAPPPHDALFWRGGQNAAIRRGDDKLWLVSGRIPWLFDLQADPGEQHKATDPDRALLQDLANELRQWESTLEPPRWPGRTMHTTIDGVPITFTL